MTIDWGPWVPFQPASLGIWLWKNLGERERELPKTTKIMQEIQGFLLVNGKYDSCGFYY